MRISSISQAHHALVLNNNNVGGSSSSSSSSLMSRTTLLLPAFFFFMSRVAYGCPYDCGRGPGPGELMAYGPPPPCEDHSEQCPQLTGLCESFFFRSCLLCACPKSCGLCGHKKHRRKHHRDEHDDDSSSSEEVAIIEIIEGSGEKETKKKKTPKPETAPTSTQTPPSSTQAPPISTQTPPTPKPSSTPPPSTQTPPTSTPTSWPSTPTTPTTPPSSTNKAPRLWKYSHAELQFCTCNIKQYPAIGEFIHTYAADHDKDGVDQVPSGTHDANNTVPINSPWGQRLSVVEMADIRPRLQLQGEGGDPKGEVDVVEIDTWTERELVDFLNKILS